MLTGIGLRKLTTLDESFPSAAGSESMAGVRGMISKREQKCVRQKEANRGKS